MMAHPFDLLFSPSSAISKARPTSVACSRERSGITKGSTSAGPIITRYQDSYLLPFMVAIKISKNIEKHNGGRYVLRNNSLCGGMNVDRC